MNVAAQLYTVRMFTNTDDEVCKMFERIRKAGYEAVQLSGIKAYNPQNIARALKENGLSVCSTHNSLDRIVKETDALIEEHRLFGTSYIGLGYFRGNSLEEYQNLLRDLQPALEKIAAAGHDVMNHSNTHADLATLSTAEIIEEIETCNDKIEAITGVRPALIRLPYGSYNNTVIEAVRSLGMEPIQWDVDSLDWQEGITSSDIYDRITSKTTSGSIILCHNAGEGTPAALPDLFEKLDISSEEKQRIYTVIEESLQGENSDKN